MAIIVECECEAVYEQVEIATTHWVEDTADCQVCGQRLGSWSGNKVLSFELIKNPTE